LTGKSELSSKMAKTKKKKPHYSLSTKVSILDDFYRSSISMNELVEIHVILGSNTVADWLKNVVI